MEWSDFFTSLYLQLFFFKSIILKRELRFKKKYSVLNSSYTVWTRLLDWFFFIIFSFRNKSSKKKYIY